MAIEIFQDSGAPSIYNLLSRHDNAQGGVSTHMANWASDNYAYVESEKYLEYRQKYLDYLKVEQKNLSIFSNLDVVHNAELTYANQKWFEKNGVTPRPVWHLGSDPKWLKMYLAEGHDYICMGGLVPNPAKLLKPMLDTIWSEILCDKDGMPKVKIHGFGMTSFTLMFRYPWFSVDSKSWLDQARFGSIFVPKQKADGSDNYKQVVMTAVSSRSTHLKKHMGHTSKLFQNHVNDFLSRVGVPMGKSEFKEVDEGYECEPNRELMMIEPKDGKKGKVEVLIEPGVCNSTDMRLLVNAFFFQQVERVIPAWPWAFKIDKRLGLESPIGLGGKGMSGPIAGYDQLKQLTGARKGARLHGTNKTASNLGFL